MNNVLFSFGGFKVDSILKSGWTGLMYAASYANAEITRLLLENGANPNFRKGKKMSVTHQMLYSE